MKDELTGAGFGPGTVKIADIFRSFPVALLVPQTAVTQTGGES
jgi:(1->4)-alpha-D-glucan 1-alpha-D-glucosylmutase